MKDRPRRPIRELAGFFIALTHSAEPASYAGATARVLLRSYTNVAYILL